MPRYETMYQEVVNAYPYDGWKLKCQMKRREEIIAIWHSLQKRKNSRIKKSKKLKEPECEQITMFDLDMIGLVEVKARSKADEMKLYLELLEERNKNEGTSNSIRG